MLKALANIAVVPACGIFPRSAFAQTFPSRPITLVVPFGAGGASDSVARALGAELSVDLKQPVVIENRPGASQAVAGSFVARAAPNGYTLMVQVIPNLIPPSLLKTLPYSGNTGFAAVAPILSIPGVLVTSAKLPVADFKEFVALLKANPGRYSYGSPGVGSPIHAWCEMVNLEAGTKSLHVPFRSYPDMLAQLVSGDVDYAFMQFDSMQFATSGKVKVLGISTATRHPDFPAIPTLDEQGLKGFNVATSFAVVATKETPSEILQRLNAAIFTATAREPFQAKVRPIGAQVASAATPAQTAEWIAREEEKYARLIREKRITFE